MQLVTESKYLLVCLAKGVKNPRIWCGLAAIFMTMLMFTLMPALLKPAKSHPVRERYIIQNKEIFYLEPETPEDLKEPEPLKPLSKRPNIMAGPSSVKEPKPKNHLAIKIDTGPAGGSSEFKLPAPGRISALELGHPNIFNASELDHPLISVNVFRLFILYRPNRKR
jgi:hypothetical protein